MIPVQLYYISEFPLRFLFNSSALFKNSTATPGLEKEDVSLTALFASISVERFSRHWPSPAASQRRWRRHLGAAAGAPPERGACFCLWKHWKSRGRAVAVAVAGGAHSLTANTGGGAGGAAPALSALTGRTGSSVSEPGATWARMAGRHAPSGQAWRSSGRAHWSSSVLPGRHCTFPRYRKTWVAFPPRRGAESKEQQVKDGQNAQRRTCVPSGGTGTER